MLAGAILVGTIVGYATAALVMLGGGSLGSAALALAIGGAAATLLTAAIATFALGRAMPALPPLPPAPRAERRAQAMVLRPGRLKRHRAAAH